MTAKSIPSVSTIAADGTSRLRKNILMKSIQQIVVYVFLIVMTLTYLFPLYWMLISALKDDPQIFTIPPVLFPNPMHWENFIGAWTKYPFTIYAANTIFRYALPVTALTVISSAIVAYGFSRVQWRGRDLLFYLCIATMMVPYQVTMVGVFIIMKKLGWVNTYNPMVVPSLFGNAYFIFLLRQFFRTIPDELTDAARIDGAAELTILFRIILPLAMPALAVVALFSFMGAWNDYLGPLIYISRQSLYPLSLGVGLLRLSAESQHVTPLAYPYLMAVSSLVCFPIILIFFFAQRTFIEGITLTGIKG